MTDPNKPGTASIPLGAVPGLLSFEVLTRCYSLPL